MAAAIGCLAGPFAVLSAYLALSRWPERIFTAPSDWAFGALSLAVGVICLCLLPIPVATRAGLALIYIPLVGYMLLEYTFIFVGVMFGDWL